MNDFDLKAAEWDNNPIIWDHAEAIAKEIKRLIPLRKDMTALEFGAGTGVTSFILKDSLKEITLMDNSSEMVKVMNNKIKTSKVKNLKTLNFNLERMIFKDEKYDLIFNQMVLHHIADIENIITKFYTFSIRVVFLQLPTSILKMAHSTVKDLRVIMVSISKFYQTCSKNMVLVTSVTGIVSPLIRQYLKW